jgi:carboxypeptidase C (cathepsin A)
MTFGPPEMRMTSRPFLLQSLAWLLAVFLALAPVQSHAQDSIPDAPAAASAVPRLPAAARTRHVLTLPDRVLHFTATAGAITVSSADGQPLGEAAYVAYTLDGAPPSQRRVTFAINGGPGASSAWLHVGTMGPWRLPLVPRASGTPALAPNADTWLDFTDLVFIDPPGTGYSRTFALPAQHPRQVQAEARRRPNRRQEASDPAGQLWSVGGDVSALTDVIQTWLNQANRTSSPRMLVGESYGGFRAPRIALLLQRRKLPLDGLVMISPVIDFEGRRGGYGVSQYINLLPSIAAVQLERSGLEPSRTRLSPVEDYARSEYLLDLLRGPRDTAASSRIITRVTELTGLPEAVVREFGGRFGGYAFAREGARADGRIASIYDASITAPDPGSDRRRDDPFLGGMGRPLTEAMISLYRERLGWTVDRPYELQSGEVLRGWLWPNSPNAPESLSALALVLKDTRIRVIVAHGFTDLVTPYFAAALQLAQLSYSGDDSRVQLKVYPGGHMFYSRDASRREFRRDIRTMWDEASTIPAP